MSNYYLGADVSKGYCDFILLNEEKQIVEKNFQLDDTYAGHCKLIKLINNFLDNNSEAAIYSGFESTGGFENNWLELLKKLKSENKRIYSARVNPKGTSHNSRADLNRTITDKVSARNIAEYLINHKKKIIYDHSDDHSALRRHVTYIRILIKQRTQMYNELSSLLYLVNPEILTYCKDDCPQWVLKVLLRYPTAKQLSRVKVSTLSAIPYISKEKAEEVIRMCKNSVASNTEDETGEIIKEIVGQIIHLSKLIDIRVATLARQFPWKKEMNLLKSFKGIGEYSAMVLLVYIGSIKNFESAKKLAAQFGVHPVFRQSGDGTWGMHMSKQGQKAVRHILYMIAFNACVHNPLIKELYQFQLSKNRNKCAALGICMHKILRIVYGMLKNEELFDPEKDKFNRTRSKGKPGPTDNSSRRFQSYDAKAPISQKQGKKRKLRMKTPEPSQNENNHLNTGSVEVFTE